MALNDDNFATALKAIFTAMKVAAAAGTPLTDDWFAEQLAIAIDTQVKTATVNVTTAPGTGTLS